MRKVFRRIMNEQQPVRRFIRSVIRKADIGSKKFQYEIGALTRMHYAYLVFQAAQQAHRLGRKRVSVIEFGVAGGNGLLWLERHAEWVEKIFPVAIEIYGFDTGEGLPAPQDYRDLPYHWKPGFFRMDQGALKARLKRAKLVLGNVRDTVQTFVPAYDPAPVGAVSHDLDFYSSTVDGLKLFDLPYERLLPRIVCYFDDVIGSDIEFYGDDTGERAAIGDFNAAHSDRRLSPIYYLAATPPAQQWHHQMWSLHNFNHPDYGTFISSETQSCGLKD
jgi:hypothetical protein